MLLLAALSIGCDYFPDGGTDTDAGTDGGNDTGTDPLPDTASSDDGTGSGETGAEVETRQVDIVFVVDNSGAMGEEQAKLATSIQALTDTLDAAVPPVDYRIAVTTTDSGNPWCQGTGLEAGRFRATSCRQRTGEFVFNGAQVVDMTDETCLDICAYDELSLPEPWIDVERTTGATNVPGGDVVGALNCMLPQGISGCGFEQPLESLSRALLRAETAGEPNEGFVRPGALLAVAVVTDETDCSYSTAGEAIFLPDGNRVFWSDPTSAAPTSAVCWNAGVQCTGPDPYDCTATSFDVDGNPTLDPDAAVLQPVSRYADELTQRGAFVMAIGGVGPDGAPVYSDGSDPTFQGDFGIGAGCTSAEGGAAVPPVRLGALVETVSGPGNLHSICDDDYGPALTAMGQGILDRLP